MFYFPHNITYYIAHKHVILTHILVYQQIVAQNNFSCLNIYVYNTTYVAHDIYNRAVLLFWHGIHIMLSGIKKGGNKCGIRENTHDNNATVHISFL